MLRTRLPALALFAAAWCAPSGVAAALAPATPAPASPAGAPAAPTSSTPAASPLEPASPAPPSPAPVATAPLAVASYEPLFIGDVIAAQPITGRPPGGFTWSPHGRRYLYRIAGDVDGAPAVVHVVDLATGRDRLLLAAKTSARGSRSRPIDQIAWAPDDDRVAIVDNGKLEVVDVRSGALASVGPDADDPQFSPDGTQLAFVRDGDLYVAALGGRSPARSRRLTASGSPTVLNGDPDWLYSEELDVEHGYRWSPDGRSIAYLQFDDTPVTPFPIQDYRHLVNTVEQQRYPLAGGANPRVSLRVVAADGRRARPVVLYDGAPHDEYLVSFAWTPDGAVVDEILDRAQRHARYVRFDRDGGASRVVSRETERAFVDVQPEPHFSSSRTMLVLSQRGGVQGLDRVDLRTGATHRLTGRTPIVAVVSVDRTRGVVYVTALAPTRRDRALLAVSVENSHVTNLTPEPGEHTVSVAPGGAGFIDRYSSLAKPPVVLRHATAGGPGTTLFATPRLGGRGIATTRYLSIASPEGSLDASLTVPSDFDPARRYPVLVTIYGGPLPVGDHFADAWPGLEPTLLAQRGILTLNLDAPAERDDRASDERTYAGAMGTVAIEGPLAAARWLRSQPFVDDGRLGLFGWSYGGYLTAFTMTHSHDFRSGIAGAPPTDWRMYDTAYTERYLGTPQRHGGDYHRSSVVAAASDLHGSLLVIHGSSDDNVHLTNSIAFVAACIAAGKPVESFVFPGARHGPTGVKAERYLESLMLEWWARTLVR